MDPDANADSDADAGGGGGGVGGIVPKPFLTFSRRAKNENGLLCIHLPSMSKINYNY